MPDLPTVAQVIAAADSLDAWLERTTTKHEALLASALALANKRIQKSIQKLDTERGRLVSTRASLAQAQELHRQAAAIVDRSLGRWADTRLKPEFARIEKRSAKLLSTLSGSPQRFAGVDRVWLTQMRKINMSAFAALEADAVDRVAKVLYEHLLGAARFRELERAIKNELVGVPDMVGRPLTAEAQRMAFDTVRNYQGQITMYKAEKVGLTTFVYYGDIIRDSRPFCVTHAGEVMDEARIRELDKQTWRGKSGPFRTHRGGYRCRHFFVATSPAWVKEHEAELNEKVGAEA